MDIKEIMKNLENNNMEPYFVNTKAEACDLVEKLINNGATVGVGGSVTLNECNILSLLRNGNYNFLDRYNPDLSAEERKELQRKVCLCDVFLSSTNALTEKGELVNVDGVGSRVGPMLFGPNSVIIITGINKIVPTAEDGLKRVKQVACPKNTQRLNKDTYCFKKGICMAEDMGVEGITSGCDSKQRICSDYVVSAYQMVKNRIKVIIINEKLGY